MIYLRNLTYRFFFSFIILSLALTSCHKKDVMVDKGEIRSFSLKADNNSTILSQDLSADISGNKITLPVPEGISLKGVNVTLSIHGETVYYNNVQIDTPAQLNLEDNAVFKVTTKEGNSFNYVLALQTYNDAELGIDSFYLEKSNNPDLPRDVVFDIKKDTLTSGGTDTISTTLNTNQYAVIPSIKSSAYSINISNRPFAEGASMDLRTDSVITLVSSTGFKKSYLVSVNWVNNIPHIYINTDGNAPITSKENYLNATIQIDGNGVYEDYSGTTKIRGRGNSTWTYPKKPYRLKLDTKAPLLGLSAEKDWVLLANYIDGTGVLNATAMKTGKLLEMPFTNDIIPVEVSINGVYQGLYSFTEQVEVESNRVNVGKDGILFEMDSYFDEDWEFRSAAYNLPVMLHYPEIESAEELTPIMQQFNQAESLIAASDFPNNNYLDYFDDNSIANFLIVFLLTSNQEINHPKSVYMYRIGATGKYTFGPIWDFDWAYGYTGNNDHFSTYNTPLFINGFIGSNFFGRLVSDPKIKDLLRQKWAAFKSDKLPLLLNYIDDYSSLISDARQRDYAIWRQGNPDYKASIGTLKTWLGNRANYIDSYIETF